LRNFKDAWGIFMALLALASSIGIVAAQEIAYPLNCDDQAVKSAAGYLISCQNEDGGFGTKPEGESDIAATCQAIIALASIGMNLSELPKGDPMGYLRENRQLLSNTSNPEAQMGRFVTAVAAAGDDPRHLEKEDYVEILKSYSKPSGELGKENYTWDDAWIIFGISSAGESQSKEVSKAIERLKGLQTESGGWSWNGGLNNEDPDTTGILVCALLAAGVESSSITVQKALEYLKSEQNADGGFSTLGSNSATDGWVIMAINAAGQDPSGWKVGSTNPIKHLLSLQKEDGSIWWKDQSAGNSFEWTANGILALTGGKLPLN
jgi:iron complex transport system substrate-binding protein